MHARVIHFGPDDCHRQMVLRSAGYTVEDCHTLIQLRVTLQAGDPADAVLMSDAGGISPQEAVALTRAFTTNPVVLFRSTNQAYDDSGFDLVIPCLTPPENWLKDVNALIEKKRAGCRADEALPSRRMIA